MRRPQAVGLAFAVAGSLAWGGRKERDQKIERGGAAWVLKGGCQFANTRNNQLKFGTRYGGGVGEDARLVLSVWGDAVSPI